MENPRQIWWREPHNLGTTTPVLHRRSSHRSGSMTISPRPSLALGIANSPVSRKDSPLSPIHRTYYNSSFSKETIWCGHRAHRKEPIT